MRTWNSATLATSSIFAPVPAFDTWRATQLELLKDDAANPKMPKNPLSDWDAHIDGCRAMRRILAAAERKRDNKTDRQLAKRTDALGILFARAPKTTRKVV